ncbi:hypothetical protein XM38_033730 [Halomicronema hongdechloris C2206]|uniref:Metal-dependent phosphohydrolase n=1 Tax=Halomicronema hongdechloris C2206 TaxID=1641165 RepID=A0A1Z3HQA5_9CYAN|nr:hypothetical protein [Halomicronema hongdechloris]ASC72416.1 hypothetical protein XM38_033730 [Halomicronema hongdechloris C2206]
MANNTPFLGINTLLNRLATAYRSLFVAPPMEVWQAFTNLTTAVLPILAEGNAPYHTVDHTLQVLWAGQMLLDGKQIREGSVTPKDWLTVMGALLCHDLGYCRGVCQQDCPCQHHYSTGWGDELVQLPAGSSDALLAPYHIERGQQFVRQRLAHRPLFDADAMVACIEMTRFPVPELPAYQDTTGYGSLCRAADLLGQLGDARYLQRLPDLFEELQAVGWHQHWGYRSVEDLRRSYPQFFWQVAYPHLQPYLTYLGTTKVGCQLIARLYTNVCVVNIGQRQSA